MAKMKMILVVAFILVIMLASVLYTSGWRLNLQSPGSPAPTYQEPLRDYG